MARYVLLEFDEDADASELIASIPKLYPMARVRAVFFKPTQFCTCPPSDRSAKGAKWGLWIHRDCGKPKKGSWQHPRNLIEPPDMKPRERPLYLGIVEGMNKPHYIQGSE